MKKKFYRRWWFWLIIVLLVIGAIGSSKDDAREPAESPASIVRAVPDSTTSSYPTP